MKEPTKHQMFAAKIRSAEAAYIRKHRKSYQGGGGWIVPSREKVYKYLSKKFNMPWQDIQYYFTYSRQCTHEWDEGACHLCPVPVIPFREEY